MPWLVLGNASNLIVQDGGIRGVVIMLTEMNQISVEGTMVIAEAGAKLIDTTYAALAESLTGFGICLWDSWKYRRCSLHECRSYGGEIKDVFAEVDLLLVMGRSKLCQMKKWPFLIAIVNYRRWRLSS